MNTAATRSFSTSPHLGIQTPSSPNITVDAERLSANLLSMPSDSSVGESLAMDVNIWRVWVVQIH